MLYVDYETYIANNFIKLEHWEQNYNLLRNKRKEIEKLDDIIRIDCFKISLLNYKVRIVKLNFSNSLILMTPSSESSTFSVKPSRKNLTIL